MIKITQLTKTRGDLPNITKTICEKPMANIRLNSEKQKTFLLRFGAEEECLPSNSVQHRSRNLT
jgi:hypothetical protein